MRVVFWGVVVFSCGMGRSKASASGSPVAAAPACSKVACAGVTVMVMVICCIVTKLVSTHFSILLIPYNVKRKVYKISNLFFTCSLIRGNIAA